MGAKQSRFEFCWTDDTSANVTDMKTAEVEVQPPPKHIREGRERTLSAATLRNLQTIQNTDGVIEAWLGEQDVFYVTLRNFRVICLRGFHLTALVDHIKQLELEEAEVAHRKMGDKSMTDLRQKLSAPETTSSSMNIKNLPRKGRQRMYKTNSPAREIGSTSPKNYSNGLNKNSPVRDTDKCADDVRDPVFRSDKCGLIEDVLAARRCEELERWTEIAATYFEAMGVVKDIDPFEIISSFKPMWFESLEDLNNEVNCSEWKEAHIINTRVSPAQSFLSNADNGSVHSEERLLAGSGRHESEFSSKSPPQHFEIHPHNRPDVPQLDAHAKNSLRKEAAKALSLDSYQQEYKDEIRKEQSKRRRFIKVHRPGQGRDMFLPGADTLGGLPEDSSSIHACNSSRVGLRGKYQHEDRGNFKRRSQSMPETSQYFDITEENYFSVPPLTLDSSTAFGGRGRENDSSPRDWDVDNDFADEPASSDLLGVTFIVGSNGTCRQTDWGNDYNEDVASDFLSNSASYFSSSSSNQEKVSWISEPPLTSKRSSSLKDAKSKREAFSKLIGNGSTVSSTSDITRSKDYPSTNGGFSSDLSSLASLEVDRKDIKGDNKSY